MLGEMTEGALELVRAWARFKSLLQLILFHLGAEANLSTVVLAASVIFTWAWEEISLANAKI